MSIEIVNKKLRQVINRPTIEGLEQKDFNQLLNINHQGVQNLKSMADIISIEKSVSKNIVKGANASFVSTTKRIEHKSEVPGPGSYETVKKHRFYKNSFDSFGTTSKRIAEFNRNIDFPFTDPSFTTNPPVGQYMNPSKSKYLSTFSPSNQKLHKKYFLFLLLDLKKPSKLVLQPLQDLAATLSISPQSFKLSTSNSQTGTGCTHSVQILPVST